MYHITKHSGQLWFFFLFDKHSKGDCCEFLVQTVSNMKTKQIFRHCYPETLRRTNLFVDGSLVKCSLNLG
jgi:hypothetical protein